MAFAGREHTTFPFFENDWMQVHPAKIQPNVGEPRENRGRLRHCNGIRVPSAFAPSEAANVTAGLSSGKAGMRLKPGVRIPVGLCSSRSLVRAANFSDKEKDEASPPICFWGNSWMPSFSVLPGSEGF